MNQIKEITKNIFFVKREDRKTSTYSLSMKIPVNKLKSIFILKVIEKIFNITPITSMTSDEWQKYSIENGVLLNTTVTYGDLKNVVLNITLQTSTPEHDVYVYMLYDFIKFSSIQKFNEDFISHIIKETRNDIFQNIENSLKELSENTSDYIKSKNPFFNPTAVYFTPQDIVDEFNTIVKYSNKQIVISSSDQPCDVPRDASLMECEEQSEYDNEDKYIFTADVINHTCSLCKDKNSTSVELVFNMSGIDANNVKMLHCLLSDIVFYNIRIGQGKVYSTRIRSKLFQNISTLSICFESPRETYESIIANIISIMKNIDISDILAPLENIKKSITSKLLAMTDDVDYEVKRLNNVFYGIFNPTIEEQIDMVSKTNPEELLTIIKKITNSDINQIIYEGGK